jgi:hypothetical protein
MLFLYAVILLFGGIDMVDLLLEKFEGVQVDSAMRISPLDAEFCTAERISYERAHSLYTGFRKSLAEAVKLENEEWSARTGRPATVYRDVTYCKVSDTGGLDNIDDRIKNIQRTFIGAIKAYFTRKYDITLDSDAVYETLGQVEPDLSPSMPNAEWERLHDEHRARSSRLLHHNEIIDEILLQLDGLTFADRAVQEIKDNARQSAEDEFAIDKKVIRFKDCFTYSYPRYSHVLMAFWHYNTGLTSMAGSHWERELGSTLDRSDDKRVGSPYVFEGRNACKLRYFKSGRWDITFASAEHADTFAREYLGY